MMPQPARSYADPLIRGHLYVILELEAIELPYSVNEPFSFTLNAYVVPLFRRARALVGGDAGCDQRGPRARVHCRCSDYGWCVARASCSRSLWRDLFVGLKIEQYV